MNGHLEQWLDAFLDNELDDRQRSLAEAHLAECEACQELLAQRQAVSALLQLVPPAQGLLPEAQFAAQVGQQLGKHLQEPPSPILELRRMLFLTAPLNLSWMAVPTTLLLAGIFVVSVSVMSTWLAIIPTPFQEVLGQLTAFQPSPLLEQPALVSGMLNGLGWFSLLRWDWLGELIAITAIGLLYLAWLAGWLVHTSQAAMQFEAISSRR
jgi:predicted anti-sigma-YlaC factor YlaD